ncbi:MAG TPA: ABC transporter permease subunit, partial [Verrucomicrobiae bacterium]|nr:ABC transporter permease subunit [Verrucomicrobiae bacterium]
MKVRKFTQFNVWPVVQRELREGARRPVNHRLRFGSAAVGTVLLWFLVGTLLNKPSAQLGGWLLGGLHTMVLGLILLIVPALTADCIARERREGTLGLLFLTPLSAGDIVAGKALAQALRALTLWLAVLPILAIPFMTGGVTWYDAFSSLSMEFCAGVLCLAAGLLASTLVRERNSAFLLAFLFGAIFLFLFSQLILLIIFGGWRGFAALKGVTWWDMATDGMRLITGLTAVRGVAGWSSIGTFSAVLRTIWTYFCCASPAVVLLVFYLVALFAARRIKRSWQDKIPSARRESFLRLYCAPLFRRRFRRSMQRTLERNPIAWLQQYSWRARASKWGLCLLFVLIERAMAGDAHGVSPLDNLAQVPWLVVMAGIYIFVGVSGFLEEKRSGALELLLITPISVNKLIFGRAWGLWKQFLPTGLVLLGAHELWIWNDQFGFDYADEALLRPFCLACGFLALPIFATYFALRVKNLIVAAVLTFIALCIPTAFAEEFVQMFTRSNRVEMW